MGHFRTIERDGVKVIECVPIAEAGFITGFSTRLGGVSRLPAGALSLGNFSGDLPENVNENRHRFLKTLGLNSSDDNYNHYELVTAKQIHSANSHIVLESEKSRKRVSCDALLTDRPKILLGIQTADCLPVLIVDPVHRAVAGIHAGWRGTLLRIVERTMARMSEMYGTVAADCMAGAGPAIGPCCFEVGPEVCEQFKTEFNYGRELFSKHQLNGKANLDLRAANREQLLAAGLKSDNIFIMPDCTRCRLDLYFSYRAEIATGAVGRMLSVIGLR
jgi:polyphenol oxidase